MPATDSKNASLTARLARRLRRLLRLGRSGGGYVEYYNEHKFRRLNAYAQTCITSGLLLMAFFLNLAAGNYLVLRALALMFAAPAAALILLRRNPRSALLPLYIITGALMLLGLILLTFPGLDGAGSLVWFVVFPPMLMYTLGLRRGTQAFLGYFAILAALMLSPLKSLLSSPIDAVSATRFLLAMLGAFTFAWGAEYIRHKTQKALRRTMARLELEALTDPLTGLGNRRDFKNHYSWVKAKSSRDSLPYSVAMIDLDHFKRVNDSYGHDVGDKVLRHVSQILSAHMRGTDSLFRWGGEEFLLLMPEAGAQEARLAAERLRRCVETTPLLLDDLSIFQTVSIGLHCCASGHTDLNPISEADRNLYTAKQEGRNRVVG
ncbi:GGDEF domain-containing protein [Desulfovibrio sp. OttesenSCG-928-C14]|nr:GGDEF domain-containing protein [Desulfovibrio sp. OttesenSCG-928-C14]